jgi:dTDP-4-dehydrorhamnose 3,5-epimerase-like enzyme
VFAGCIEGHDVAAKVDGYGWSPNVLEELENEVAIYQHLSNEKGVVVPRLVAHGFIAEWKKTCYMLATELMGSSHEFAPPADHDDFERAAEHVVERLHAKGLLLNDIKPQILS